MFNILVAEDDEDMRELFCTVLSDSGYNAFPAADGEEALEIMEKEYIDLIVADIMMPNMDGYELTKSLRDAKYDLPVLMVTAKDRFDELLGLLNCRNRFLGQNFFRIIILVKPQKQGCPATTLLIFIPILR